MGFIKIKDHITYFVYELELYHKKNERDLDEIDKKEITYNTKINRINYLFNAKPDS